MKVFRYLIFFSVLTAIFFLFYLSFCKKGFSRLRTSFREAIIAALILSGTVVGTLPNNKISGK